MPGKRNIHEVLKKLQGKVGLTPEIKVEKFSNWAKTQVRDEVLSVTPVTVSEVQAVVRAAGELGLQVRAAGKTHSWTPLFSDEGNIVMHVSKLQRPDGRPRLELSSDPDEPGSKLVTMVTGVTTGEFRDFQLSHGVCIPANVVLRVVQMGGVVTPACHGAGLDTKSISDDIVSMRIIDSSGVLRTYSVKDDPHMMRAVQCSMGLWGIVVDFTIKVDPMIMVETQNEWRKVKEIFYDKDCLRSIVEKHWSVEILWFPFNSMNLSETVEAIIQGDVDIDEWDPMEDVVWLRLINKLETSGPAEPNIFYEWSDLTFFLQSIGFGIVDDLIVKRPSLAPWFLKSQIPILKKQFKEKLVQQLPNAIHFRSNISDVPVYDMEWAIPLDKDLSNIVKAVQGVIELVRTQATNGKFPMNLPLEMRFVADSDVYLAPMVGANPKYGGSGHTCMIEVLTVAKTPGWAEFRQEVADLWQTMPGAIPHWCKEWQGLKDIDQIIRKGYAKTLPKYLSALERSGADPKGMFFNQRLEHLLYPKGHPSRRMKKDPRCNII